MGRAGLDKDAVIAAAAVVADREGSDRLTLTVLADQLGVRVPSLYSHVAGIDGLRHDLLVHYLRLMVDRVRWAAVGVAGREAVIALAKSYADVHLEHPGVFGLPVRQLRADAAVAGALAETAEPMLRVLRGYGLDRQECSHWLRIIWTAAYGFAFVRSAGLMAFDADADDSFHLMIEAFANSLEARSAAATETAALSAARVPT